MATREVPELDSGGRAYGTFFSAASQGSSVLIRPGAFSIIWLPILLLSVPVAHAGSPDPGEAAGEAAEPSVVETQEVVISATRTQEDLRALPGTPTVLTRKEIDTTPYRGGHETDDLLRNVPGVQPSNLSSRYNHPTAQNISVRGLGTRRALILLDGIPLNDGFGGWINWGLIPDTVQRIEVVPGGGSNLYGTWAMGGVIHVLTEPVAAGTKGSLEALAGNLDTYTTSLAAGYGTERLGVNLGYRWFHTNGFVTTPEDQRGPIDQNNDSRHQLFTGSFAWAVTPRIALTVGGNFFREDRSFGTPLSLATRTIGTATLGLSGDHAGGHEWQAKLFAQWQTFRNKTSIVVPSPTMRLGEVRDRIQEIPSNDFGGSVQWTARLHPRHRVVLGGDARGIIGQSEVLSFAFRNSVGRSLAKGRQVGWGVFGEWIAEPVADLTLIPSLRTDWWKNFDGRIETEDGTVTQPGDNVETAINPKLALQYRLTDSFATGASVYRAFRAPTLNELYRGFAFAGFTFLPNASLSPERLRGADAKLEAHLLSGKQLTIRVIGHYEEVKDQIVFVPVGPTSTQRQNVGRTRTLGAEVDLTLSLPYHALLNLGYGYADSIISSFPSDPTIEGHRIPDVSRHQVLAGVTIGRPDIIQLAVLGRYLSRQFADARNTQPIADFAILDASLTKDIGKHVRLFLNGENLTDRRYIATQTGPVKTLGAPRLVTGGIRLAY